MAESNLPKAKYPGELNLNGFIISCAVLEDGTRIFSERSLANAFGIKGSGAYWQKKKDIENDSAILPEYLSAKYLKPFISNELMSKLDSAFYYEAKINHYYFLFQILTILFDQILALNTDTDFDFQKSYF
jgi:hypothetical protein